MKIRRPLPRGIRNEITVDFTPHQITPHQKTSVETVRLQLLTTATLSLFSHRCHRFGHLAKWGLLYFSRPGRHDMKRPSSDLLSLSRSIIMVKVNLKLRLRFVRAKSEQVGFASHQNIKGKAKQILTLDTV